MHSLTRRLAVLAAAAALTVTAAACGSTQASNTSATASSGSGASAASTGQAFPVSIAAANGRVKVASRPTAICGAKYG